MRRFMPSPGRVSEALADAPPSGKPTPAARASGPTLRIPRAEVVHEFRERVRHAVGRDPHRLAGPAFLPTLERIERRTGFQPDRPAELQAVTPVLLPHVLQETRDAPVVALG